MKSADLKSGGDVRILERLLEHPAVYRAWQAPFAAEKFAPVERHIRNQEIRRVLDVGCGPGTNAARFIDANYVGIDINERYLEIARSRWPGRFIQGDLESVDLSQLGMFDTILVNSFLHHLPDKAVERVLAQITNLLEPSGRVHILELVLPSRLSPARVMARLDRGRFARPLESWMQLFAAHFSPLVVEPYRFAGGLWSMVYFQGQSR